MVANLNVGEPVSAWKEFVGSQKISISVDPPILRSWKRCWGLLNPYQSIHLNPLHSDHLLSAQITNFDFISVSRPVMEDIYQYMEGSSIALALTNSAGCILDILGDQDILTHLKEYGIETGVFLSEHQLGTNAFALALLERLPIRVIGAEHYLQHLQDLAEVAAPVFDLGGRPLGTFGLFTFARNYQPYILGLSVAGERAIEGQRISDQLMEEQNHQLAGLNAIVNTISDGIMVWDENQVLMFVNGAAAKILGIPIEALVGRRVGALLSYPRFIQTAMERMEPITDIKARIFFNEKPFDCIFSLRFVEKEGRLEWIIASFRLDENSDENAVQPQSAQVSYHFDDIVWESSAMRKVRRLAKSAASAKASILICGENGTGKNTLANALHHESRQEGPFIIFPCSSIPQGEQIAELLGYEEGISSKKPGGLMSKFELAEGGTLYFQDIDRLSLEAQGILLNFLEIGVVYRLGSGRPIPVGLRVIASTSANLKKLIAEDSFRADLYYRISPFEITLPPLREREQDIPILVKRILARLSQQLHRNINISPEALRLFMKYSWPGNLRELDTVVCRAAGQVGILENIRSEHLPAPIQKPVRLVKAGQALTEARSLDEVEENVLVEAASLCRGNISEMSRVLGIGRTTVWRKLKTYNIPIQDYRQSPVEVEE